MPWLCMVGLRDTSVEVDAYADADADARQGSRERRNLKLCDRMTSETVIKGHLTTV